MSSLPLFSVAIHQIQSKRGKSFRSQVPPRSQTTIPVMTLLAWRVLHLVQAVLTLIIYCPCHCCRFPERRKKNCWKKKTTRFVEEHSLPSTDRGLIFVSVVSVWAFGIISIAVLNWKYFHFIKVIIIIYIISKTWHDISQVFWHLLIRFQLISLISTLLLHRRRS